MKSYITPNFNYPITEPYHAMLIDFLNRKDRFIHSIATELIYSLIMINDLDKYNFKAMSNEDKHSNIVIVLADSCPIQYKLFVEKRQIIPANIILFKVAQLSNDLALTLNIDEYIN